MGTKRITWVSIARGLTILLVVMRHVQLVDMSTGQNHMFCVTVSNILIPWIMPLFFFISGGLLWITRIRKGWKVKEVYYDKVIRLLVPFAFFVVAYYFVKIVMGGIVKTPTSLNLSSFLHSFAFYTGEPSAPLWFLPTLFECMLCYPLYLFLYKKKSRMLLFLAFLIIFYFIDFSAFEQYNYFNIFHLNSNIIYFFSGILFFRYELYKYFDNKITFFILAALYAVCYLFDIDLLTGFFGILMAVSLSMQLSKYIPNIFSSFREYSYQIYLMSFFFQGIVELILWKKLFYNESLFLLFYALNVAFGVYGPVCVTMLVKKIPCRPIRLCFGLK